MWEKFVALDLYRLHIFMMFRSRYVILADSGILWVYHMCHGQKMVYVLRSSHIGNPCNGQWIDDHPPIGFLTMAHMYTYVLSELYNAYFKTAQYILIVV